MNCMLNDIIDSCIRQNKEAEVIDRYLRLKHNISIDKKSIKKRVQAIKFHYKFT
ncbi:MAG: hypothetical protein ACK40G_13565 [Cytophagaceae bacterium]